MSDQMYETIADAAVSMALNHRGMLTHKDISKKLQQAADLCPSVIEERIARLRSQITLLEAYLPKG